MESQIILKHLQITFGKIPKLIEENMRYLKYNDDYDNFTCTTCDKIIQKVCNNEETTTKNFEKHLLSIGHKKTTTTDDELWKNLNITFSRKIPQIVQNNRFVLGIDGKNYKCVICSKTITVSSNMLVTENNFSYHLLSSSHEDELVEYREALSQLHEVYGGIPRFILNHMQFLSKNVKDYFCTICKKHLAVHPTDIDETEKCFEKHLHSLKHMRNAKQEKTFSLIPELKQIFSCLPNYLLRHIEYISINGLNFFCSLCNENIKFNKHNIKETKDNFKLHISSRNHEDKLSDRRDSDNDVFNRLHSFFETFPDSVLDNLKYISVNEDDFYCSICKETIFQDDDNNRTKENLIFHFESVNHENNDDHKLKKCSELIEELKDIFGSIPQLIQDNIEHIEFREDNKFECVLCEQIVKAKFNGDYDSNSSVTKNNFKRHFKSKEHKKKLTTLKELRNELENDLEGFFTCIPQFILNNMDHLGYDVDDNDDNDDNNDDDFYCLLCEKTIALVNGNKKEELTEQNFRNHILSVGHMAKLKHQANLKMETTEKLESIFNKVPNCVLNNIEHVEFFGDDHFLCTLCGAQIMTGDSVSTERTFREHLYGSRHTSNLKELEDDNDEALQLLDAQFWRIPEFLLRNIDFLCTYDDGDLFCILCQEILFMNEDDLESTKRSLRCHMDSAQHQSNLKSI